MSRKTAYIGELLCGEIRNVTPRFFIDEVTQKKQEVIYLRLLVANDRGEDEIEVVRLPDGANKALFVKGTVVAIPVSQWVDKKTGKIRRTMRTDIPPFAAPEIEEAA